MQLFKYFPLSVSANSVFTCEAKRVSGDNQLLTTTAYEKTIYPTMFINNEKGTILYVYSNLGRKWENNFTIIDRDKNYIAGINKLQADWIKLIHVNLKEKEFSILYAGDTGNT